MDLGSEKNSWGQSLWWGLHLVPPEYLRWEDWKLQVYEVYDNQIKFIDETRRWQAWYFVNRKVTEIQYGEKIGYFKYVPFDRLPDKEKENFNIWEMRNGIQKINPEPGRKCIYRDDFLNWIKEKMVIRYHEMMAEPPERNYEKDNANMDAQGALLRKFRKLFDEIQGLRALGVILPEPPDKSSIYWHHAFNPDEQSSLNIIYDFLPDLPGDCFELIKRLTEKIGKRFSLTPLLGFKDRDLLDPKLITLRKGPNQWATWQLNDEKDFERLFR